MDQVIIFILGYGSSGKSTLIRALTGARQIGIYLLRSNDDHIIRALVNHSSPQERGCEDHPPDDFPSSIEELAGKEPDDWDVLISALQIRYNSSCPHIEYIDASLNQDFIVKIALIERDQDRESIDVAKVLDIQTYCEQKGIELVLVDAVKDPNVEANKIREKLFP